MSTLVKNGTIVTAADRYGLKIPYLRRLMHEGAHAATVRGVLPTSTYPSHTGTDSTTCPSPSITGCERRWRSARIAATVAPSLDSACMSSLPGVR